MEMTQMGIGNTEEINTQENDRTEIENKLKLIDVTETEANNFIGKLIAVIFHQYLLIIH